MSVEPGFIRKALIVSLEDRRRWIEKSSAEAATLGFHFGRASLQQETNTVLLEFWLDRPDDQGEPRFESAGEAVTLIEHSFFKSRSDLGYLASGRAALKSDPVMARGYLLGLEVAAAAVRSHILSAARKFGPKSSGVRVGRADLCCIEREIRRRRTALAAASESGGAP